MLNKEMRLSDLVEREHADEILQKHKPISFKWEFDNTSCLERDISIPDWIIDAMIEFANEQN